MAKNQDLMPPSSLQSHARTFYQQDVSNFLSLNSFELSRDCPQQYDSNVTSWIDNTARSVALRSVTSAALDERHLTSHDDEVSNIQGPLNWDDFMCMTCGTPVFPPQMTAIDHAGVSSSSSLSIDKNMIAAINFPWETPSRIICLRNLKRGRTRRRRASRCRSKQLQNESLTHKRLGGSNSSIHVRRDTILQGRNQRMASLLCVGDGQSRQSLVTCCRFCRTKTKRKGVDVFINNRRRGGATKGSCNGDDIPKTTVHEKRKKIESNYRDVSIESQIREGSNFISLNSISENMTTDTKNIKQRSSVQPLALSSKNTPGATLLGGKKKSKAKKPTSKAKSNLMDFLSSLNN